MSFKGRYFGGSFYDSSWYRRFFIFISSIKYDKKSLYLGKNKNIYRKEKYKDPFFKGFDIHNKIFGAGMTKSSRKNSNVSIIQRIFRVFKSLSIEEVFIVIVTLIIFISLSSIAVWIGRLISEAVYG